jgi:predicted transglutaminase-like cysteine proteinase
MNLFIRNTFAFLSITISVLAFEQKPIYFKLTNQDINNIKSSPKASFIINRLKSYKGLLEELQSASNNTKLKKVNRYFNKIIPSYDQDQYLSADKWATRKDFLFNGKGDCEDYAIAKYFTLIELGFSPSKLFLTTVRTSTGGYHMVLAYYFNLKKSPLILDNLSFKVLPFSKRKDLTPKYCQNNTGTRKLTRYKLGKKIRLKHKDGIDKFKEILRKEKEQNTIY